MIHIGLMPKEDKEKLLLILFDIYYQNTSSITHLNSTHPSLKSEWTCEVSFALDKPQRNIIIARDGDNIVGFAMLYTNGDLLMVEEIQIVKDYQRTRLLFDLCRFICDFASPNILRIEAYAIKSNSISIALMHSLGFLIVDESNDSKFLHLAADAEPLRRRFTKAK